MVLLLALVLAGLALLSMVVATGERGWMRVLLPISPIVLGAVFLIPWPVPDAISLYWQPDTLFPDPILFRSTPEASIFSFYVCVLLLLFEWGRPFASKDSPFRRAQPFVVAAVGWISFSASNALAVFLSWTLLDILSLLSILITDRERTSNSDPASSAPAISRGMAALSINVLGSFMVLYAALTGPQSTRLEWSAVWSNPPTDLALILFLVGVAIRLAVVPFFLSLEPNDAPHRRDDSFFQIISAAVVLSFLAKAWPAAYLSPGGHPIRVWLLLASTLMVLFSGFQWWASSEPLRHRSLLIVSVTSLGISAAAQLPQTASIFQACGSIIILGGGVLAVYPGLPSNKRWMAVFLLPVLVSVAGLPFSPGEAIFREMYSGLASDRYWGILLPLFLGQLLSTAALIRSAMSRPVDSLPHEPLAWLALSICMTICGVSLFLFGVQSGAPFEASALLTPLSLGAVGFAIYFFGRRFQVASGTIGQVIILSSRVPALAAALDRLFSTLSTRLRRLESILSGEGAILWALGIVVLAWLAWGGI